MSERMEATGGRGGGGGGGGAGGGEGIAHTPPQQEQQNLIESFRGITSSTPAEALFFLESHAWQLDAAVQSFFDADEEDPLPPAAAAPIPQPAAASSRRRRRPRQLQEEEDDGQDDEDYVPPPANEPPPSRPATRLTAAPMASSSGSGRPSSKPSTGPGGRPAGGIRTLADLNRRSGYGSGSDTDEESDGPQEYYTGGEKSGMLVQDPSKGNPDIDSIFEQARQMGATQEPIEHFRPSSSSKSFTGTGRLLTGETVQATAEPPESVIHEVVFWTNGFTVNDGPLRRFDDPENAAFLESIKRSECPKELEPADRRTAVHVSLSRREQKCPEPVKRFNPFGGVGRTLGAGSSTSAAAPEAASASASASAAPTSAPPSAAGLYVDESLPSTSIQLRLADGTRMVARFNHHHTVGDIRGFIDASRPGAARSYQLQTVGFPPKQLADVTQTIEEAGLANSVVIQKL